jgi:AcrR family transcriptional regulator
MTGEHEVDRACERRERRDSVENRRHILAIARQLCASQGVDDTSMHEIGRAAQVGQGTLYRNFAHKGDLCRALLEDDLEAFLTRIDATLDGPGAPKLAMDRLGWLLEELIRMTESHVPLLAAIREAAAGPRRHEAFRLPFYTSLHERITRVIEAAVAQGEVEGIDAAFAADAILAAVSPPLFAFQRRHRSFSTERITEGVRRLFVYGLRSDRPDH